MIRKNASLAIVLLIGLLATTATTITANESTEINYEIQFAPYFIGRQQSDNVIVVNHSSADVLRVKVTAYDPFTGEEMDAQSAEIRAGTGKRIRITETYPNPHASRLVVEVNAPARLESFTEVFTVAEETMPEPPFSVTRILTTKRDDTVFQVSGQATLLEIQDGR